MQAAKERLEKEGHRVVVLTGADSGQEKERERKMFNPEAGEAEADIMIASDAGATGMNVQRGQWLAQMDTPDTAMVHGQRQGRIFRTGQRNNVELLDLVANHTLINRVLMVGWGAMFDAGYFWHYNELWVGGAAGPGEKSMV